MPDDTVSGNNEHTCGTRIGMRTGELCLACEEAEELQLEIDADFGVPAAEGRNPLAHNPEAKKLAERLIERTRRRDGR